MAKADNGKKLVGQVKIPEYVPPKIRMRADKIAELELLCEHVQGDGKTAAEPGYLLEQLIERYKEEDREFAALCEKKGKDRTQNVISRLSKEDAKASKAEEKTVPNSKKSTPIALAATGTEGR